MSWFKRVDWKLASSAMLIGAGLACIGVAILVAVMKP